MGLADRRQTLDLAEALRPGLDLLANEILIALKKRSRLPHNPEVYEPGLVRAAPGATLLDHVLGRVERLHAELGRYTFASQESFTEVSGVVPAILRAPPPKPIAPMESGAGTRVKSFYLDWVRRGCRAGSDPNTYGETVTADVEALLCILERVNLGKFVAESKFGEIGERFREAGDDPEAIRALLVRKGRETQVYDLARRLAAHYEFDTGQALEIFRWMIETTIDIEVAYIRMRLEPDGSADTAHVQSPVYRANGPGPECDP